MIRDCDQAMPAAAWHLISKTYSSGCSNNTDGGNGDKSLLLILMRQSTAHSYPTRKLHVMLSRYEAACT